MKDFDGFVRDFEFELRMPLQNSYGFSLLLSQARHGRRLPLTQGQKRELHSKYKQNRMNNLQKCKQAEWFKWAEEEYNLFLQHHNLKISEAEKNQLMEVALDGELDACLKKVTPQTMVKQRVWSALMRIKNKLEDAPQR